MKAFQLVLCLACLALPHGAANAQAWPPWANETRSRSPWGDFGPSSPRDEPPEFSRERQLPPAVQNGGPRPEIASKAPAVVAFAYDFPVNSIVIDTGARKLYYVIEGNRAYAYPISVGREGFNWSGTETVSRKQAWPDWHPPAEMRERDPALPEKMTGGVRNPLGAMALYLGTTLYRIHGTNDAKSIGRAQSSGCFRMLNSAVLHLASLTEIGTPVTVVTSLPRQEISRAPEPTSRPQLSQGVAGAPVASPAPESGLPDYRSLRDYTLGRSTQVPR